MPKRKPSFPQRWPGHQFNHADVGTILARLNGHDPQDAAFTGERFAVALLEKTPSDLKKALNRLDNEVGNSLVESLMAAEEFLEQRRKLVMLALARVAIASGVAPWVDPDQAEGAANG